MTALDEVVLFKLEYEDEDGDISKLLVLKVRFDSRLLDGTKIVHLWVQHCHDSLVAFCSKLVTMVRKVGNTASSLMVNFVILTEKMKKHIREICHTERNLVKLEGNSICLEGNKHLFRPGL